MKTSQTYPNPTTYRKALTRFAAVGLLALASSSAQARMSYVFDNEGMFPTQFPAADGWTINAADRVGKVAVTQYGLDAQVSGGAFINGGTRALRLIGNTTASGLAMNNFLTYQASGPIASAGPIYFGMTVEAETEGTATDPQELFLRIAGWSLYVAMKSNDFHASGNTIEIVGASAAYPFNPGLTYRIVGRLDVTAGNVTAMKVWVNPAYGDEATPTVQNNALSVPLANLNKLELRSQKAVTIVDDLKFGASWNDVVPPLPADPGNLIVTLPADTDLLTPGYQITGGTLFVKVGGVDYVASTPLAPGTNVTFQMIPDTVNFYELTGWRGYKGPRDSSQPFRDFTDATILGTPSTTQVDLVIPIYAPLNIRPIFEFGEYRLVYSTNQPTTYRVNSPATNTANRLRTLFDAGETVKVRGIPAASSIYYFGEWVSPAALSLTDTSPNLTVGAGVLTNPVTVMEVKSNFSVLNYMTLGTTDTINSNDGVVTNGVVEFEANNLGGGNSVPLCVMKDVVAEKAPLGLAGVCDFETLLGDSASLFFDPSPGNNTPVPGPLVLARDGLGAFDSANSFLRPTRKLRLQIGLSQIDVETGFYWYTENGLATEDGPAPAFGLNDNNYWYDGGFVGPFLLSGKPSDRVPSSGDMVISNATSYEWTFNAADKVVMAGAVYMSRGGGGGFQHYNPDDNVTLWSQATYNDGTKSAKLYSTKLEQSAGGADHFFGFEAPAGKYITSLHIWCRGRTARAFSNCDDLVVVLEGGLNHTVAAASNNVAYGTVSGGGSAADGTTVTLTATPSTAPFLGWAYACAPCAIISTDPSIDVNVHGSVSIKGIFDPHPAGFGQAVAPAGANLQVDWFAYPEFNYTLQSSPDLVNWTNQGSVIPGTGANESRALPFNPPSPLFLRVDYCSK